jgi:GT2 family glycosyltransferase
VVDNGSTDGSQQMVREQFPDVHLVANTKNEGYCRAGNQGAAVARGRHLLFLNDDILILEDALPRLVEFLDVHPRAGMAGSRLLNIDLTDQFSSGRTYATPANALFGRKSPLTRMFPKALWARRYLMSDKIDSNTPYEVDWISAAAMMVRGDVFREVGGLAENFYYFHEMVFCRGVQRAGYRVYLDPQSKIIHYEGAGSGVRTPRVRRKHIVAFHRAAIRWYCHHHGISPCGPLGGLVAAAVWTRAGISLVTDTLLGGGRGQQKQLAGGRPEGGVAL